MNDFMRIGLTGGMGCGKSTVLRWLAEMGVRTFESDACVRRLYEEDGELRFLLSETFGSEILDNEGKIDRRRLASIVFSHPSKLELLESLVHPRVRAEWLRELGSNNSTIVVEIPLLFEKSLSGPFDVTVCVATSPETQLRRLQDRGLDEASARARLSRQWSVERKMEKADHVLFNDGEPNHLLKQVLYLCNDVWALDLPSPEKPF